MFTPREKAILAVLDPLSFAVFLFGLCAAAIAGVWEGYGFWAKLSLSAAAIGLTIGLWIMLARSVNKK